MDGPVEIAADVAPARGRGDMASEDAREPGWVDRQFWVPYAAAEDVIAKLEWLAAHPPVDRARCLMIEAPTNHGKTQISYRFKAEQAEKATAQDGECARVPVVRVFAPPGPDRRELLIRLLTDLGAPIANRRDIAALQDQFVRLVAKARTRVIMIDEFHQVLGGGAAATLSFLNALKDLVNVTRIPHVALGMREATRALQTDRQLGNRFEIVTLPRWQVSAEFCQFAGKVWSRWFPGDVKLFRSKEFCRKLHADAEGLTGETVSRLREVARHMGLTGASALTEEIYAAPAWELPSRRRERAG